MNISLQRLEELRDQYQEEHIQYNIDRLDNHDLDRLEDTKEHPTIRDEAIYYLDSEPLNAMDNVMFEQGQRAMLDELIREVRERPTASLIPKIESMQSPRGGGDVPNQFIITVGESRVFQSYSSIIAIIDEAGNVTLDRSKWDYSTTTGKYRNQFLGESKKETEKKIKSGAYTLADLNQ